MAAAHVEYAYSPRQNTGSRGRHHLVLDQALNSGRIHRRTGDVLCQPSRSFWGLHPSSEPANCPRCLDLAARCGITTVRA